VATTNARAALVQVEHVSKHFGAGETRVDALHEVSLDICAGQATRSEWLRKNNSP
jgi:predicted ABC-type transport system involved in lysophospholipase L1 biosynthesis ATPase subunit